MNGLEDALHDHLAQFDEPMPAKSVRYVAHLEQKRMQAGLLPAKGKMPMTTPMTPPPPDKSIPQRVRIYEHVTQSRFLHIEDALGIGKLRFFAGAYERNKGAKSLTFHFLSVADARVVFGALLCAEPQFTYKEYKGSPPQNGKAAVSRVLSVTTKGENVYIELKTGPGKLTNTGAITPNGQPTAEVNVAFKTYEARRMAATVLAYLHAWDVMQMIRHQHLVSQPQPYLLVPATSEGEQAKGNGKPPAPVKTAQPAGPLPPQTTKPERPVTRKGPPPPTNGRLAPPEVRPSTNGKTAVSPLPAPIKSKPVSSDNGRTASPPPSAPPPTKPIAPASAEVGNKSGVSPAKELLTYGDGTMVADASSTEAETFRQFVAEKQEHPASRTILRDYYSQRGQTTVTQTTPNLSVPGGTG